MINILRSIFLSALFAASLASARIIAPIPEIKKPVFIWDVGGVSVEHSNQLLNMPQYIGIVWESDDKVELTKAGIWCLYNLSDLRAMGLQGPEDLIIEHIASKHPVFNKTTPSNNTVADQAKEVLCSATPIEETQKIIVTLSEQGFPVALGSNKGEKALERMINNGSLPDLDYVVVFGCDSHDKADKGIYYKKPNPQYYEILKETLQAKGFVDNSFIFIDEKQANIEAAAQAGMIGILYTTPEELRADLQQLGIILRKE
jgi:beta-phosphoglucomutase-like phosphatase (HAD superfamily)